MKIFGILLIIIFISESLTQEIIDIWNEEIPYDNGEKANLTIFLPNVNIATGRAIVIFPGGGYSILCTEHEGTSWAPFFNQQGIAIFILSYRLPKGNHLVPISDAEEAIRIVRRNADKWKIDKNQVGIMGFSAGGHLASTIATHSKGDAKPNFHILFYPVITMDPSFTHLGSLENFLGKEPNQELIDEYSNELHITNETPRVFITLCNDDEVVQPKNGMLYYKECNLHDVSTSLHIYPTGGHGWGYSSIFEYHFEVLQELKNWLQNF